jgi:ABC-type branched-subunit amino acid transport system ATPase component
MQEPILKVQNLSKHFGGVHAVQGVSCEVMPGQIFAVIGPNGAGKTTFFNCLSGTLVPSDGAIEFEGKRIEKQPAHRIAALGMARTWQTIRLFAHLTVLDNVLIGCHSRGRCGFLNSLFHTPWQRREERALRQEAFEQLERLEIGRLANASVDSLPFLQQRRVELARALAARPRLLLLDEPAAGLNTRETAHLGELIESIRQTGVTILLVEHDMSLVMDISDRVLVLDHGVPLAEGSPREIQENEKVIATYLGSDED